MLGSQGTAAATDFVKKQQAQLDRLLSRRVSGGVHESVGRAVPAVAVRRSSSGEVQCEPVLLYFGVIDFLQVGLCVCCSIVRQLGLLLLFRAAFGPRCLPDSG